MDSMRRNAQKMMPHVMALNKKPTMGMKNDRQPAPAVSNTVAYAKGGGVSMKKFEGSAKDKAQDVKLAAKQGMSFKKFESSKMDVKHDKQQSMKGLKSGGMVKGDAADMKQDKALLARHNRLMHPGQKSKLMNGGMVKKYADGGTVKKPVPSEPLKPLTPEDKKKAKKGINPYPGRSEDMEYAKGGMVKGDKKKVMGTVGEAKAVMAALQKARRPATPMPGTRMAGLGMAPPMAPPMKRGGKVMKKAAGGAAKLRRKSPMPDKIKMVNYPRGG